MTGLENIQRFFRLVTTSSIEPRQHFQRLKVMERNIGVPVKIVVLSLTAVFLFGTDWHKREIISKEIAVETVRAFFLGYVMINVGAVAFFLSINRWPLRVVHWVTLLMNFLDAMVIGTLVVITTGINSMVYWMFPVLIVRNAISVPVPVTQILLNLMTSAVYAAAIFGWRMYIADKTAGSPGEWEILIPQAVEQRAPDGPPEDLMDSERYESALFALRLWFLVLWTALCYGVQVLFDKDRETRREAREYTVRKEQLRSTGRLAAEIAHRLKNPLAIINNAAFVMGRQLKGKSESVERQLDMIRDEVGRSDLILTELMDYARLSDGKVERLIFHEELDNALREAFPPQAKFDIKIKQSVPEDLPVLMMQRAHLREILLNILVNAREASREGGEVRILCQQNENYSIEVTVSDDGDGVAPDQVEKIFESFYSTKERGTGLGLAIVKQNTELYGGEVCVKSELGKGATFVISLPSRALLQDNL